MPQVVDLRKKKPIPEKSEVKSLKKTKHIRVTPRKSASINKIEWTASEFRKYKKNKNWFILPTIIALAIFITAILLKNFLLAIAIILATFVVYTYTLKEPRKIKFSISGRGIQIDKNIYRFEDLRSFWVFYEPPEIKEISLRSKKMFMPYVRIPLGDQNPVEIRRLLLKFLPERKHTESITDEWARKLRF